MQTYLGVQVGGAGEAAADDRDVGAADDCDVGAADDCDVGAADDEGLSPCVGDP